jgi:hypothetical protein
MNEQDLTKIQNFALPHSFLINTGLGITRENKQRTN